METGTSWKGDSRKVQNFDVLLVNLGVGENILERLRAEGDIWTIFEERHGAVRGGEVLLLRLAFDGMSFRTSGCSWYEWVIDSRNLGRGGLSRVEPCN